MAGIRKHACIGALALLGGCQTVATDDDVPARIVEPNAASRAALQSAVNDALMAEVMIAPDALTSSNLLIIERLPPAGSQGRAATGRNMDLPVQFRLVMVGTDCVLLDTRDDSRRVLSDTSCAAL
jgi:hypothetical protein